MFRRRLLALLRHSTQYWKAAAASQAPALRKLGAGSVFGVLFYTAAAKSIQDLIKDETPAWDSMS